MGSGSAVAIALLGGCMHWAAFELLGGTRTASAPIKLIFWESPWGRAGAGSGGVERLVGMARVWRALYWGKAMQRGFGASCLGRTWSGPQGSLLALLLLCITHSLGKPLCGVTASRRGLGSLVALFLLPSDEMRAIVCLDPSWLLSPDSGGSKTRAGGAQGRETVEAHPGTVPSPGPPGSPHHRWVQFACAWLLPWDCRVVLCFRSHLLC